MLTSLSACGPDDGAAPERDPGSDEVRAVLPERGDDAGDRDALLPTPPEPRDDTQAAAPDPEPEAQPADPDAPLPWPATATPMRRMLLAGTWSPDAAEGFDRAWIDETGLRETFSLRPAGRRRWQGIVGGENQVNLDALTRGREDPSIAYVYAIGSRPPPGGGDPFAEGAFPPAEGVLHVRHIGRLRAWWDGELILDEQPVGDDGEPRHVQARVPLTDAYDVLLLKLGRGDDYGASMNLEVSFSDTRGKPIPGHEFVPRRKNEFPSELTPEQQAAGG